MKPRTDVKTIVQVGIACFVMLGLLLWASKPTASQLPSARELSTKRLDPDRQIVQVRLDSLTLLLNQLQGNAFRWRADDSNLSFEAQERKDFNQFLLDGNDLTIYQDVEGSPLRIREDGNGFSVPIRQQNGIRYVTMPADLVHNLQLYQRYQQP